MVVVVARADAPLHFWYRVHAARSWNSLLVRACARARAHNERARARQTDASFSRESFFRPDVVPGPFIRIVRASIFRAPPTPQPPQTCIHAVMTPWRVEHTYATKDGDEPERLMVGSLRRWNISQRKGEYGNVTWARLYLLAWCTRVINFLLVGEGEHVGQKIKLFRNIVVGRCLKRILSGWSFISIVRELGSDRGLTRCDL